MSIIILLNLIENKTSSIEVIVRNYKKLINFIEAYRVPFIVLALLDILLADLNKVNDIKCHML